MMPEQVLREIVLAEQWLMEAMVAVQQVQLPDWYIGGGVIRNLVWDVVSGYEKRTPVNDIDVAYFDEADPQLTHVDAEKYLSDILPQYDWDVKNQAHAHTLTPGRPKAKCTEDGIYHWTETATCVGVRLEDDALLITAQRGLHDLFDGVVRPTGTMPQDRYQERIIKKQWGNIWPGLTFVDSK